MLQGDWAIFRKMFLQGKLVDAIKKNVDIGMKNAALLIAKNIRTGVQTQKYKKLWKDLSPITLAAKSPKTKLLINQGSMLKSVQTIFPKFGVALIGIPTGTKAPTGNIPMWKIGSVHENGDNGSPLVIRPKKAKRLFIPISKAAQNRQSGLKYGEDFILAKKVTIPIRPWIQPAYADSQNDVDTILEKSIKNAINQF